MTQQLRICENCGNEVWLVRGDGAEWFLVDPAPLLQAEAQGILVYTPPGGGTRGRAIGRGGVWRQHSCADAAAIKARSTDPDTSKASARQNLVRRDNQRGRIVRVLVEADTPLLPDDVVSRTGIPLNSVTTRMAELVRGGWAVECDPRTTQRGGRGLTYAPSDKAKRAVHSGGW